MAQVWDFPLQGDDSVAGDRPKINNMAEALRTLHSGPTEPSATVAGMLWFDTTTNLLKLRNSNDDGWIVLGKVADSETNLGLVRKDGDSNVMTGSIKMRTQKLLMDPEDESWIRSPSSDTVEIATANTVRVSITDTQLDLTGLEIVDAKNDGTTGAATQVGRVHVRIGGLAGTVRYLHLMDG